MGADVGGKLNEERIPLSPGCDQGLMSNGPSRAKMA